MICQSLWIPKRIMDCDTFLLMKSSCLQINFISSESLYLHICLVFQLSTLWKFPSSQKSIARSFSKTGAIYHFRSEKKYALWRYVVYRYLDSRNFRWSKNFLNSRLKLKTSKLRRSVHHVNCLRQSARSATEI